MTPTIDQIEAALPYVPAGLHCGDLTEPDERREFAEVIHGIVVAAMKSTPPMAQGGIMTPDGLYFIGEGRQTAPESRQGDETDPSAQSPQNDPQTPHRRNNGVSSWGPPKRGTHESDVYSAGMGLGGDKRYIGADRKFGDLRGGVAEWCRARDWSSENKPTDKTIADMSIAWGISEALIEGAE